MSDFQAVASVGECGEYDPEVRFLMRELEAAGIVLIVFGGNRGEGCHCRLSGDALKEAPDILRSIADELGHVKDDHAPEPEPAVPEDFRRDFTALVLDKSTTDVPLTRYAMWSLMAAVQLASRHPAASESPPLRDAAGLARLLQKRLATTPALARVAEQGWDLSDAAEHGLDG
jgi:hypothetical protein